MHRKVNLSIHDPARRKLCELYDSKSPTIGQAYDIILESQMNGWKELSFSLPYLVEGKENWRNAFVRGEFLVRLTLDGVTDWYIIHAPSKSHKGQTLGYSITCSHLSSLLNKKNLFVYFDDENGIGTAREL